MFKKRWLLLLSVLIIGITSSVQVFAQGSVIEGAGENILALGPGVNFVTRERVMSLLTDEYGNQVRHWTQKAKNAETLEEADFFYIAYPNPGGAQNKRMRDLLRQELMVNANKLASVNMQSPPTVCLYLMDWIFWGGDEFASCHTQGESWWVNLGGFDNRAESYFEGASSNAVRLYDSTDCSGGFFGEYEDDQPSFGVNNNKASCMRAWY